MVARKGLAVAIWLHSVSQLPFFLTVPMIGSPQHYQLSADDKKESITSGDGSVQTFVDAVEIYVFDASRTVNGTENGVAHRSIVFAFSPEQAS